MKSSVKALLLALCAIVLVVATVFTTLAFLQDQTQKITNTFTIGKVDITLVEHGYKFDEDQNKYVVDPDKIFDATGNDKGLDYDRVSPGIAYPKDPTVTVKGGSEASWVFIKVEDSIENNAVEYSIDTSTWQQLEAGVYFKKVEYSQDDQPLGILTGNTVTIADNVTAEDYPDGLGSLAFTAYAIQAEGFADAETAWAEFNK